MIEHLPLTIGELAIDISDANFGNEFVEAAIKCISIDSNLKKLELWNTKVDGEEEGQDADVRLAHILTSIKYTLTELYLQDTYLVGPTNIKQWGDDPTKMSNLT